MSAPLIQVSTLAPFVGALEQVGLSSVALGRKVGLTPEILGDPESLAPSQSIYRFAEFAAEEVGDPFLGVRLGLDPQIMSWSVVSDALSSSQTMIEFFACFLLNAGKFTTDVDFRLVLGTQISVFERDRGFKPRERPSQIDAFGVGLFVNLFRSVLEENFRASDLLFKVCDPEAAKAPEIGKCGLAKGDTRLLSMSFPSEWLVRPIRRKKGRPAQVKTTKPPSEALITSISSNIRANISDPTFGVPMLVEQMGFNRRDVQKYLRDRGSGLAEMIEEERKKLAGELLEQREASLQEIAGALGYTDVSNFSRAFRRWTGMAPSFWRERKESRKKTS